jgi:hypothetical protein
MLHRESGAMQLQCNVMPCVAQFTVHPAAIHAVADSGVADQWLDGPATLEQTLIVMGE